MKKLFIFILMGLCPLVGEISQKLRIDEIYWDKGWLSNDLYIHTSNEMWWKVLAFEHAKPKEWQIGDGVTFSKYPFEHGCQYWLINLDHFGGMIVEYLYEAPIGVEK